MGWTIVGFVINLLGSLCSAFGYVIQKKVHTRLEGTERNYLSSKLWWFGMFCIICSIPCNLVAAYFVKLSIIGVLSPFNIITNIILARFILGEKVCFWEYIGITLFIPGTILTLMFSTLENHHYTREEIQEIIYSTRTLVYMGLNMVGFVLLMTLANFILKCNPGGSFLEYSQQIDEDEEYCTETTRSSEAFKSRNLNVDNATSKSFKVPQKLLNLPRKRTFATVLRDIANNPRLRFLPLLIYPYFGPFVSSLTMTITRILFGFLKDEIDTGNVEALCSVDIFLYLALIPILACTSYLIINKALKHYETIYVIPLFKVGTLMHSLLSGTIFLQEFADASFEDLIFFILGAILCLCGIGVLILGNDKKEQQKMTLQKMKSIEKLHAKQHISHKLEPLGTGYKEFN